jgi:hypothetical protein
VALALDGARATAASIPRQSRPYLSPEYIVPGIRRHKLLAILVPVVKVECTLCRGGSAKVKLPLMIWKVD